jgi:hypothetical protein
LWRLAQKLQQLSLRLATKESVISSMQREYRRRKGKKGGKEREKKKNRKKEKLLKELSLHPRLAKIYPSIHA